MSYQHNPLAAGDEVVADMRSMLSNQMLENLEHHKQQIEKFQADTGLEKNAFEELMVAYVAGVMAMRHQTSFEEELGRFLTRPSKKKDATNKDDPQKKTE